MSAPPYLDIRNAEVYRGDTRVFQSLNLRIHTGENVAVLGPNGAGKTTLLKLLTRELYPVVKPDSYIRLFGEERVMLWELRRHLGLVSQDFQNDYSQHVRGLEVILSGFFGAVGMHGHHQVTDTQGAQALQLADDLGVADLTQAFYAHLSTGQQRRLILARALVHAPEVLVLDEPTNGLDIAGALRLTDDLRRLARSGTTLLVVTHHLQEIVPEIDRVVFLKDGQIVADGPKRELLTDEALSELFAMPLRVVENDGFYQALLT